MRIALMLVALGGCSSFTTGAGAPISPLDRFGTYRHVVEYELQQQRVKGEACASATVSSFEDKHTHDRGAITNGYLYEKAKVLALDAAPNADGLIEIRSVYTMGNDGNECVVVTGRPYRVTSMKAVPGIEPHVPPPVSAVQKSHDILSPNME